MIYGILDSSVVEKREVEEPQILVKLRFKHILEYSATGLYYRYAHKSPILERSFPVLLDACIIEKKHVDGMERPTHCIN